MEASSSPRVDWALLADYALIDQTSKLSAVGIFDQLTAPAFPTLHPLLHLVWSCLGAPSHSLAVELRVWGPTKDLLIAGTQQAQTGPDGRANGVFRLSPFPLPAAGKYLFELLLDGTSARHLELRVMQVVVP
jgi:hypothetical protein